MKYLLLAAALGAGVFGGAVLMAQQTTTDTANLFPYDDAMAVARGQNIYAEYCAACHGANLQGQDDWRTPNPDGRAKAPPHDQTGHTWHHPDVQLFQIVKFGTAAIVGNGYESDMAGYDGILSDGEIFDVMAFIKDSWPDQIIERHNDMNSAVASQ